MPEITSFLVRRIGPTTNQTCNTSLCKVCALGTPPILFLHTNTHTNVHTNVHTNMHRKLNANRRKRLRQCAILAEEGRTRCLGKQEDMRRMRHLSGKSSV